MRKWSLSETWGYGNGAETSASMMPNIVGCGAFPTLLFPNYLYLH